MYGIKNLLLSATKADAVWFHMYWCSLHFVVKYRMVAFSTYNVPIL